MEKMPVLTKLFHQGRVRARELSRICLRAQAMEPEGKSVPFRVLSGRGASSFLASRSVFLVITLEIKATAE